MTLPLEDIALHVAAAIAAFFQSVTGIGFGMIAGPVILVVMDDPAAVMISTLMSWLVAAVLWPFLRHGADMRFVMRLCLGAAIGLIAGAAMLAIVTVTFLKLFAGLVIGGLTLLMLVGAPGVSRKGSIGDLIFGAIGGVFGGALAMPGPPAALRGSGVGFDKTAVRATMVCFFVVVWPMIYAAQIVSIGISLETLGNALRLVPATLAGLAAGHWVAQRVSETLFRRLVFVFLFASAAGLLINAWSDWSGT
ncbi:MAG: sulfite exporter TauE/SafE family protein [Pseudomonadota bacterium]